MNSDTIISENKYKQKIVLNPQEHIGKAILRDGLYDAKGLYYIERILAKLDTPIVFDIGANIGNHALVMAQYSQMVYLFEPQTDIAAYLRQTMFLNKLKNWRVFELGLADETYNLPFYKNLDGNNGASTFISALKSGQFAIEELPVYTGDEVVAKHAIPRVDFIKIDVEGFEAKVIYGLQNTIQKYLPIIILEWNNQITKQQFEEYDLFNNIFADYAIKTIINNHDKSRWRHKFLGKLRRLFYKCLTKKR